MSEKKHEINFDAIPQSACMLAGGAVEIKSNGENAKTAPVRLTSRSGQPIEHPYWGRIVHDMSGMRTHKAKLPIDYAHNDSEVLGYLNHFDVTSGDLVASGAIVPFRPDDRASEVLYKMREGVPYEASIFFGGDGIQLQNVATGEQTEVNGYMFAGPGVVVRQWPLRGVAICPYGADANTESVALSSSVTIKAHKWTQEQGDIEMEQAETVEAEAVAEIAEVAIVEAVAVDAEATELSGEVVTVETVVSVVSVEDEAQEDAPVDPIDEPMPEVGESELDKSVKLAALNLEICGKLDAVKIERDQFSAKCDELSGKLSAADMQIVKLTAETEAAKLACVDAQTKLAAILAGHTPVSAAPAENKLSGSIMERARMAK